MVQTRSDLKLKIKQKIQEFDRPFKTFEVQQYSQEIAPNINVSMNRIAKYIGGSEIVKFNKKGKVWKPKIKPVVKIGGEKCHEKTKKNIINI